MKKQSWKGFNFYEREAAYWDEVRLIIKFAVIVLVLITFRIWCQ